MLQAKDVQLTLEFVVNDLAVKYRFSGQAVMDLASPDLLYIRLDPAALHHQQLHQDCSTFGEQKTAANMWCLASWPAETARWAPLAWCACRGAVTSAAPHPKPFSADSSA